MSIWSEHLQKETLKDTDPVLYEFLVEYERSGNQAETGEPQRSEVTRKPARLIPSQRLKMTNLSSIRRQKHMTQTDLSRVSGVSSRTITGIENGRNTPSVFVALILAAALESSVEELFYIGPPDQPVNDFTTGQAMIMKR